MSERYFKIDISEYVEIHVFIKTINGLIVDFMVKLIWRFENSFYEVVRFDSGHDCPHEDILNPEGKVIRKIWYEFLDNKQALDLGIKDLKENYEIYIERFKKWLKK